MIPPKFYTRIPVPTTTDPCLRLILQVIVGIRLLLLYHLSDIYSKLYIDTQFTPLYNDGLFFVNTREIKGGRGAALLVFLVPRFSTAPLFLAELHHQFPLDKDPDRLFAPCRQPGLPPC